MCYNQFYNKALHGILRLILMLTPVCFGVAEAADIEITTAVTGTQNVPQNQSITVQGSGSVTTDILGDDAIMGSTAGEGGNTITLESGAVLRTTRPDDGTNDSAHGIQARGSDSDSAVTGLSGGGALTDGASNIVNMNAGSTIYTSGKRSYGIYSYLNNSINVYGDITTYGEAGYGIYSGRNNEINFTGSITTSGIGASGVSNEHNSLLRLSGSITTSGKDAYGVYCSGLYNTLISSSSITTSGESAHGIRLWNDNNITTLSGTIKTSGINTYVVYVRGDNNVFNVSGNLSATGANSYALYSGMNYGSGESNTFHFLNGSSLTGEIHNADSDDGATSFLTFGYTKNGDNLADLTSVDNTFSLTLNDSITSDSSGNWDGYFAGGTTTLNGSTNTFRKIFVGADSFDNAAVAAGHDNAGGAETANLAAIGGATATLNVNSAISTDGTVAVGEGSTYNLSGTHTHTGTDITVTGSGKIDLDNGGNLVNNASGGTQSISNLNVSSGTGTLSGNNALDTVSNADIDGTLNFEAAADTTISAVNLGGTLNNNSANNLTLSSITVDAGGSGTLAGSGAGGIIVNTANINGTLNFDKTTDTTFATTNLAGTLINNSANNLTLTDLTVDAGSSGALSGSGAGTLTITNAPTINGILDVNRDVTFNGGITSIGVNGVLGGSGNIIGDVTTGGNGGKINPDGTLTISGNGVVSAGDQVELSICSNSPDKLMVTGTLDMTGASVSIDSINNNYVTASSDYTLIEAGVALNNLDINNVVINENSVLLDYAAAVDANSLNLQVLRVADGCKNVAGGGANAGVASVLDDLSSSQPSSMDGLFNELNRLTTNTNVNAAMSQLQTNQAASGMGQTTLNGINLSTTAIRSQLTSFRMGSVATAMSSTYSGSGVTAASADQIADAEALAQAYEACEDNSADQNMYYRWTGFTKVFGGFGQQGSSSAATGYDFGNAGIMVGLDYAISEELRFGGLVGYSYNNYDLYSSLGCGTDNTLRLGGYASFNRDKLFVDIAPSAGIHMIESMRNITFMDTTARGQRTGVDFNLPVSAGYEFEPFDDFFITPNYGLSFTTFYDPQYTESGASGGANLRVDERAIYSLQQTIDIKAGKLIRVNKTLTIFPEVWGGWEHEYLNTGGDVTSAFAVAPSQSWTSNVSSVSADRAVFGCGLTALINDNISVFGRYDHKVWDKGFEAGFTIGAKVSF